MQGLNRLLKILLSSAVSVAYLVVLLLLFMFIAGLLGMQVRGVKKHHTLPQPGLHLCCAVVGVCLTKGPMPPALLRKRMGRMYVLLCGPCSSHLNH